MSFALAAGIVAGCVGSNSDEAARTLEVARLSGAIFTTLVDGTRVNANIYQAKTDVYLDGGPGPGAPKTAAGLPDGNYYFQVTDPSGKTLLSQDAIECREVVVDDGVITAVVVSGCQHLTGDDVDHDATTVQLMPYANTPNPGGEYKVWMTSVDDYDVSDRQANFGFIENESKTDNYKIREPEVAPPPPPYCGDGNVDAGEYCDDGNDVNGDGCENDCTVTPPPPPPPCCGDGHVDAGEECDDGNTTDGDGCSSTCTIECPPPPPPPCCGNGVVEDGEQCDDGNTYDGDGCSSTCETEVVCTNPV